MDKYRVCRKCGVVDRPSGDDTEFLPVPDVCEGCQKHQDYVNQMDILAEQEVFITEW